MTSTLPYRALFADIFNGLTGSKNYTWEVGLWILNLGKSEKTDQPSNGFVFSMFKRV